jgi:hypothetical protein
MGNLSQGVSAKAWVGAFIAGSIPQKRNYPAWGKVVQKCTGDHWIGTHSVPLAPLLLGLAILVIHLPFSAAVNARGGREARRGRLRGIVSGRGKGGTVMVLGLGMWRIGGSRVAHAVLLPTAADGNLAAQVRAQVADLGLEVLHAMRATTARSLLVWRASQLSFAVTR